MLESYDASKTTKSVSAGTYWEFKPLLRIDIRSYYKPSERLIDTLI